MSSQMMNDLQCCSACEPEGRGPKLTMRFKSEGPLSIKRAPEDYVGTIREGLKVGERDQNECRRSQNR